MSPRGAVVAVTPMGRYRPQRIGLLRLLGDLYSDVVVPRSVWKEPLPGGQHAPGIEDLNQAAWILVVDNLRAKQTLR
jgi:hypothetical protein